MITNPDLQLKGFTFAELFYAEGLERLDGNFLSSLAKEHPDWHANLLTYRLGTSTLSPIETSELLINCAVFLEQFLASFFTIEEALAISQVKTTSLNPLSVFKKYFVLRRAKKEINKIDKMPPFSELQIWLKDALNNMGLQTDDPELAVALLGVSYLEQPDLHTTEIEKLVAWCTRALTSDEGKKLTADWPSFLIPERLDYLNLVPTHPLPEDKYDRLITPASNFRQRDGFKLTDPRMSARQVQDQINYCIYCHDHEGDFCSKGFPVKKSDPAQGFKKNPLDTTLTGCPLEEKISEMNFLKKEGYTLASLAMVMIDNPMCPATGHRICNDCMKACIYQKQDPVNIPQIETRVLTDVLDLPWGVEIYDLLTRWNPLRQTQWTTKSYNGLKVMIAGMGPAGFTLAHHLLLEGFAVVGFDGLKIEPLPDHLLTQPIYHYHDLVESLDERLMAGFGGVAEYGITVRWDKNFLKLIYLSLKRRPYFQVFGSVRFGGTITVNDAWEMGFDHFVVAVGAGLPKALSLPGSLAPGMRQANDFLMALQLGNAAKSSSLTNLQIRLPAVVIGGGLTGVDTATEVQAYYITLVEKVLTRYEILTAIHGEEKIQQQLDSTSREILNEYLQHGRAVRKERDRAQQHHTVPDFISLIHSFGGVTIAYRRSMQESPAYINNHEELKKALEEGVYYAEGLEPIRVELNEYGHAEILVCHQRLRDEKNEWRATTDEVKLPARSILVATGTQPNTAYEFEHRGTFNRLNLQYQHYEILNDELTIAHGVSHCKEDQFGPFTSYHQHDKRVSLIGDTHPVFHGSVVKAIASGLKTYPKIVDLLKNKMTEGDKEAYRQFAEKMNDLFTARVKTITRRTNHIVELIIHAPLAAKHFKPGEFYRLQNFETFAPHINHTLLQMEPLALVTAECDHANGTLTFIVDENTTSAKLCKTLQVGEPVSLMGPTGVRAKIPSAHETILIIGQASHFAFVRSYGAHVKAQGNHVIYLCQSKNADEIYCQSQLEDAVNKVIWLTQTGQMNTHRKEDIALQGNDIEVALQAYHQHQSDIPLENVDRIFVIGNTDLLRQVQSSRKKWVQIYFPKDPKIIGSVYGNMQCMLKGVCAQCLQWQIDPETGLRTKAVFACSWQDQPIELIDISHIDERQKQNQLLDHLSSLWVDYIFEGDNVFPEMTIFEG